MKKIIIIVLSLVGIFACSKDKSKMTIPEVAHYECYSEDLAFKCKRLGDIYRFGEYGVKEDKLLALNHYKKACDLKPVQCRPYGQLLLVTSDPSDLNEFKERAKEAGRLFKLACSHGDLQACGRNP